MYTITYINNLPVIEIDNFLSSTEIDQILEQRKHNFNRANSHYPKYYRNNDRLEEDNSKLASDLTKRLKNFKELPLVSKQSKSIYINSKIRFCRYQKGQLFSKHQDGVYYPNSQQESRYTFLLYLNDHQDFEGGNTDFFNNKYTLDPIKTILPKKGKLVIFDHHIWHTGTTVSKGNKYILRSDIITERKSIKTHHDGYIWSLLEVSKNSFLSCGRDKKIKLWDTQLNLLKNIQIHSKSVLKIIKSKDDHFYSCSRDFTIKKWNLNGETLASIELPEMILCLHYDKKKNEIVAGGTSGKIYVFDKKLNILKTIQVHNDWIWDITLVDKNIVLTCCEDGTVQSTNIETNCSSLIFKNKEPLFCITTKEHHVFTGAKHGTIIQINLSSGKSNKYHIHRDIIRSIHFYNDYLITAAEDNTVKMTSLTSNNSKTIFKSDNFMQDAIIMDNKVFAAGYNGTLKTKLLMVKTKSTSH